MPGGSTLPKRAMGRELRRLRVRMGASQAAAARVIEVSPQTIGRMEDGQATRVTALQINALCDFFQATDEERRLLLHLVQELRAAQQAGANWWRNYADEIPSEFNHYLGLEDAATKITLWHESLMPGLLQTPGYRRALIWAHKPDLPKELVERRVALAGNRRKKLQDPDFHIDAILSESVLMHAVGGPGVMGDQLHHLIEVSEASNISVRVVPFRARSPIGLIVRSFVLLEFADQENEKLNEPPVAYIEGYSGDLYVEREIELSQYQNAVPKIQKVALSEQQTRDLIAKVAEDFRA